MSKTNNVVTLAVIAKEVKIAPKSARRILRNSDNTPKPVTDARWAWLPTDAKKVKALLKSA